MGFRHQRIESNSRAAAQMEVGRLNELSRSGMPMISQDFSLLTVMDDVVVAHDFNVVQGSLGFVLTDAKVGFHVEHQIMSSGKRNGISVR